MRRLLFVILLMVPCFIGAQTYVNSTPSWFKNPPKAKGKVYGVGSESSSSEDIAESKALLSAKVHLAKQVEPVLKRTITRIDSVTRGDKLVIERVTAITESVKAELTDVRLVNKAFRKRKGKYTAWVLLEMNEKEIISAFAQKVRNDKLLREKLSGKPAMRSIMLEK